jgi:hypothetical protein
MWGAIQYSHGLIIGAVMGLLEAAKRGLNVFTFMFK